MAKDKRSRDQKRKNKLAQRAVKHAAQIVEPYTGRKYQQPEWAVLVASTELAIYEVLQLTDYRLTNDVVRAALTQLVHDLRAGKSPTQDGEVSPPTLAIGREAPFVIWNISRHWTGYFADAKAVAVADLVGILRTLLWSIVAHGMNTGSARGYVAFLAKFMKSHGVPDVIRFEGEVHGTLQPASQAGA